MPEASVQARNSRGPGSHCGGTVLTAPRVQSAAMGTSRASTAGAHQRGVLVGPGDLGLQGRRLDDHLGESLRAPQPVDDHGQPSRVPEPTSTTWPGAASSPVRSATAGGTDSAEKKDSWLTIRQ